MGAREEAWAWLKLNGKHFERGLKQAKRDMADFQRAATAELRKVALAVAAIGVVVAAIGANFAQAQAQIAAVSGGSVQELALLEAQARSLGASTEHSATQAAKGQENLLRAGFKVGEVTKMMAGNLALASAGQKDLAFTAELEAASLKAFSLAAEESNRVVNLLQAATTVSRFDLERLMEAMKSGGPVAAAWGMEIEESVAAMAALVDVLGEGGGAGTALKMVLAELTTKAQEQKDVLGEVLANWDPAAEGIVGAVERIERAGLSSADVLANMGAKAGPGLAILLAKGSTALRTLEKDITGTNAAFDAAATQMDTTQGDIKTLISALQELALRVFDQIKGPLRNAIQTATRVIQENYEAITEAVQDTMEAGAEALEVLRAVIGFVADHKDTFVALAEGIGAVTIALYAAATATAVWTAATAASPITWIAAALAVTAAGVNYLVQQLGGWEAAWIKAKTGAKGAVLAVQFAVQMLWEDFKAGASVIAKIPEFLNEAFRTSAQLLSAFGRLFAESFKDIGGAIKAGITGGDPFEHLRQTWSVAWDDMVEIAKANRIDDIWKELDQTHEAASASILERTRRVAAEIIAERDAALAEIESESARSGAGGGAGGTDAPPEVAEAAAVEELVKSLKVRAAEDRLALLDWENTEVDARLDTQARHHERWAARVHAAATAAYSGIAGEAAKYATIEQALRAKVGKFFIRAAAEAAAGAIEAKAKEAAVEASFEGAAALAAFARYDFGAGAKHLASAAKYVAISGGASLAANVARNIGADRPPEFEPYAADAATAGADATGTGTRGGAITLGQRTAPETVNIFINTTVNGHILGDFADVVDRLVVPRLTELQEGGAY